MFRWPLTFIAAAIVAALFGFGAIDSDAVWLAKALVFVFLGLAVLSLLYRGPSSPKPAARSTRGSSPAWRP